MDACLVYHVDKGLGIVSREAFDFLYLRRVREDRLYQGDAPVLGKGVADQSLPGGRFTAHDDTVRLTDG